MAEYHDEQTLFVVRYALTTNGWDDRVTDDIIRVLQNAGIVFRKVETAQQASERIIEEVTSKTEVNQWDIPEEMLLTRDQGIRVQAIDIAVRSFPIPESLLGRDTTNQALINTAEKFEDYIRNGVIHNG